MNGMNGTKSNAGTGSPDRTLLLVGGLEEHLRKAKALGLKVVLLQHPTKYTVEQEELADLTVQVDYTDWDATKTVVEEVRETADFTAVVSLTEAGVDTAARLNDLYGLGGTGHEVTARIRDKWAMRRHMARIDPAAVGAALLETRADLDGFGDRYGYPFVVKPTDATASFGVFRVEGPEDTERVWAEVERLRGRRTDRGTTLYTIQEFLMEEYVDGPEFSVESFSFAGRHVVVAITEKFVDESNFTELGHALPARLDEHEAAAVRACVAGFLDAVGLTDGTCHTEVRIGGRGPAVIESHNRPGGDAIPDLVRGAYGIDLATLALGWPFGLVEELPDRPLPERGASTRFLVGGPGTVASVEVDEGLKDRDDVLVAKVTARPGDAVRPLQDNWDRLGMVAVTAPDTTAAIESGARLIESAVRIRIAEGSNAPSLAHVAPVTDRTRALESTR